MKIIASLLGATALILATPALAEPGGNKGGGKGGFEHGAHAGTDKKDKGQGPSHDGKGKPPKLADHGPDQIKGKAAKMPKSEVAYDHESRAAKRPKDSAVDWSDARKRERERDSILRVREARNVATVDRRWDSRIVDGRAKIAGCPPGLAKKNNGCMPPGLAAKRNDWIDWRYRDLSNSGYRYGDGYLYQLAGGRIANYIPLLGGALSVGNAFPTDYFGQAAPAYYGAYFGRNDDHLYRYADGGIFAVDPKTQLIQSIVGLVTGNNWTVGQQMPSGYDVYNVPPAYRDRYRDGSDSLYRYDDGYVYQVDPKTRLITTAISLLS